MFEFLKDKESKVSKTARSWLIGIAVMVAGLLIFQAGMAVGFRKARFSYGSGDRYERNFVGPRRGGMMGGVTGSGFVGGHGVSGQVVSVNQDTLLVRDRDGAEKTVVINDKTSIRLFRDTVTPDEINPDDFVTVIGDPDADGKVIAKFIRIMPEPLTGGSRGR